MATQIEELESIPATKPEREEKELLNEVTSIDFFPNEVKKLDSKPNQTLETSNYEEQTANIPVAIKTEFDQENIVTEAGVGSNQGETFLNSPPFPEVTTNDSSSTPKDYEATKINDQAEEFEIERLEEEILKDQKIDIVASKETSDEQQLITEEKQEESQRDDKEHAMNELEKGERLSESSSIEVKEVWLNDKENEGPNVDDTDESTAKQIAKKDNFKDPLVESTGEETVGYSKEEDATEQKGEDIESFDAIEDVVEVEMMENKVNSRALASNTEDLTAKSSQEYEMTKERPKQEVSRMSTERAAETEVQVIDEDNTANFGPSAGEEINEANLKGEQKESDIEANRTNENIEEQKTEESANEADLPSTATGEEIVNEYLKEDETDKVKPKEEVKNLETESIQNVEEEIHQKEINEDLFVSSSMPQVSQKETEDDNLDKEESAITELTEERSIKEIEQESNSSDLLFEEKIREIEVGSDDVNIIAKHSEVTEIVSYSQEEDAMEQKGAEIESFDSIEDMIEVEKVENKIDSHDLESNTDDIIAKTSQEDETEKERPEEEMPRIIIEEANLKREQKESDIEMNSTNKEIDEQKTKESANEADLPSTATGEEIVTEYLKEDETDEVKPKEEIKNLETESNEDLVVNSSMPQVSQKETENNNLDKEESAISELMEERRIKEVEKESNSSDLLLEEKSWAIEVESDDVNIIAERSEVTEIVSYSQEEDATEQKGAEIESFDAIEDITEVEKVENKIDSQDLESNTDDIKAKNSQGDETEKERPEEEVPRIRIEEAAKKEAQIMEEDITANFRPSAADEESNEENLKMEQKESDLEVRFMNLNHANKTNKKIEEEKTEESDNKADLPSTATGEEIVVEYLKEDKTDEVKPNEEVKNLEDDNLDEPEPVITELIEERNITEVEQESNNSDLFLEEKPYSTIPKGEDERELTSGEMSISYLLEQTLEESSAPLVTESQLGVTEVSDTIDGNTEIIENSHSNLQSLETAEKIEEKLEKKENEPMNPIEDMIVELKDIQMDNANTEENPESVVPLELGSPIVLVAEGKSNETYLEINQTKTDEDKENVNVQILEGAEEKAFLASDKTYEEKISREISQEGQNESEEVEPKSESERQINEAEYMIEAINDDILTEEALGEAKKAEESEHINEQLEENIEEVGNQVDEADINKAKVVAKPNIDKIEVEELKISDTEPIREITEMEKLQDIKWEPEASPIGEAPEIEILKGTEEPINFTTSESALSEANTREEITEELDIHKDEAETAAETSSEEVQLVNESTSTEEVLEEVSAPEHAEINKESVVLEKSATDEVEELNISDVRPIIGNTKTAELQAVKDMNLLKAEASSTTKEPEEKIIEEVGNHGDESETAQETVVTVETSSEGVQLDNVSTSNLETIAGEYVAVDNIEVQEVDNLELQDSSVISQLASTEHADINKETMVVKESSTDETEVEELEIPKAETISYVQNDHLINESEKISSVKSSNTNIYKDEAGEETVCELEEKTYTIIPKGEDERETPTEQPLGKSSAPSAAESQIGTTEVSEIIDGNIEIIEKKENEPMDAIDDTPVELKDLHMDDENVEEVLGEAENAEESEYINEQSEEIIGNHGDEAETAVDTMELQDSSVISEATTEINKESVVLEKSATDEVEELKISDVNPIIENTETEELQVMEDINQEAEAFSSTKAPEEETAGTIELQEVDNMELQDSSVISQLASTQHAEVNKLVVEESATDDTVVEELEISNAETSSCGQTDHLINESEKISTEKSSDTNTCEEETYEVLESKSEAKYQVDQVVAEVNNVLEPTHSAEDLAEQFQMPSSATLLREQESQTTTTTEKVEDESPMKEETLVNEKLESIIATNPKEETCLPESEVEISTLDLENLDKNAISGESSTREAADLQETRTEEPREYISMIQLTDTISYGQENQEKLDSENSTEENKDFLVPHFQANSMLPTEAPNLELQEIERVAESASDLQSPEVFKSEEREMKEEQTQVEATESRDKENLEEKLIEEDENIDDDISTEKTTAGNEDAKDSSIVSLEEVHVRELSQALEPVGENKDSTEEGKAAGDTYQDLNVDGTYSSSCTQETEKDKNVEEALTRLDLQERGWNGTNVETKSPNQEIEGVTVENGEAKKIEDIKEEFVEDDSCITEVQTTSASEETTNEIAYSDPVRDDNLEAKVWSKETKVEELKATEDFKFESEVSSLTETSEKEIKQGTQIPVDITSSVREASVEEIGEEEIKEATILNQNTDAQPVTLVSKTCLEEVQEAEKLILGSNTENQIEKADEANDNVENTHSSEKLSDDLPLIGAQEGNTEENDADAGKASVNSNQDSVAEGPPSENLSQEADEAKNVVELPREVETVNQTDCNDIDVETTVLNEKIKYSDSERIEITEATALTAGTEIENLRAEDLESKSEALADEISESNENSINITNPVVEVPEEDIREEKGEADSITDAPSVTKEAHMSQEDEEVDSVKFEEISSMVTQISREQHAFIGTEEVTAEKTNANEAEEIITSERLASIGQDPKNVFETDKVQEEMNSVPDSITEEKEVVKDFMSSASVPIEELCEEPQGIYAQEKAKEHNAKGTADESLPQETNQENNVNKAPSEVELQATEEESEENEIHTEPTILIEENRETVPREELITTYDYVAKDQIDEPLPDTNSKTEDSKNQNLESTVEKIIGQDFQEVQSEMNKEVGHKLEENEETRDVNETKKDVFLMEEISQEAVEDIREVEEIVNIKEEITEGGSCTEELKATSETDENLSKITNSDAMSTEKVEEIRASVNTEEDFSESLQKPMVVKEKLEKADIDMKKEREIIYIPDADEIPVEKYKEHDIEDVQINREITTGVSIGVDKLEERDFETELKYQADEPVIEGGKISDLTHLAKKLAEKSYESSPSKMIQREQNTETTHTVDKVEEVLEYLPEALSPNTVTESEVREVEEVHPKTASIASMDEENQSQIANEKTRIITKEVPSDKNTLDKEVAEDSLLLSADEEKIRGSCLEDEIKMLDYPGEITNQKLETTMIRIPAEESPHEHEKAAEIKNIISLGDRNVSEILPEEIKDENCLKEAPTDMNLQEQINETCCRDINTEDKTVIEESSVSEQDLIKHETDQAGSTEKNNVSPSNEVRSKDFEAQTDEGEVERKDEEKEEEEEGEENEKVDSGSDGPVMVEVARDVDVKACKKSHGILSGVGSKVKHSISKVKKVITGKSSQKSSPPK